MPYVLAPGANAQAIAEREYASDPQQVMFTAFTSCIGVLSLRNGQVTGVHLSISAPDGSLFDNAAADQVVAAVGAWQQIKVIGQIAFWENPANGVSAAFAYLIQQLNVPQDDLYPLADGTYGGENDNGTLELTY
ncbi:hypothetical protein [Rhodocista pekingensis]|uniref:Uncharacterized protein n=1 Tax=Rhodocista pekingensis TaxID=201185 RepID=A0ABW2KS22_9PROT